MIGALLATVGVLFYLLVLGVVVGLAACFLLGSF